MTPLFKSRYNACMFWPDRCPRGTRVLNRASYGMSKLVVFYKTNQPYSNFHPCCFELDGRRFTTSEHAMMYCKAMLFDDEETAEKIVAASHPKKAKSLGRKVAGFTDDVWKQHREAVMERVLYAKFSQNERLKAKLMNVPRDCLFVEASPHDRVWGVGLSQVQAESGHPFRGLNLLGKCLDRVKCRLHGESQLVDDV